MTRPSKDELMMCMAIMCSTRSTCKRLKVGALITDERYEQVSIGWNGGYISGPNDCLRPEAGRCGCIHAEINALIKCKFQPHIMFLTDSPCEQCAAAIVNTHVREVVYAREYRVTEGIELLEKAGILIEGVGPELLDKMIEKFEVHIDMPPYSWKL